MGDLKRLSAAIVRIGYGVKDFVETYAEYRHGEDDTLTVHKATELIRDLITKELPWGATRVVFVKGPAGCGKTYVLRKMAEDQALEYEYGKTDKLFLYVDAQGKALARFDEAIAKELQDLRAPFTYHALAPLSRRGCLVVIVDGFDELLGSGGYDEAFASLSSFLGQLGGEGSLVASARSTFYDYTGFRRTAQRFAADKTLNYVVEPLDICLWGQKEVTEYFTNLALRHPGKFVKPSAVYEELIGRVGGRNQHLLKKPFYVAKIAELYAEGMRVGNEEQLLQEVVERFIDREVDKFKDVQGKPLLTREGHTRFLTSLAEEMWWQETRQVDIPTVQTLAELLAEQLELSPGQVHAIVERVPSNAFLASVGNGSRALLRFEHEVFYSYFLARRLHGVLDSGGPELREFLSRSTLPDTVIQEALGSYLWNPGDVARYIHHLGHALSQSALEAGGRENSGRIVAALITERKDLPEILRFRHCVFKQCEILNSHLVSPQFENCFFEEVDLRGSSWNRPIFAGTMFRNLIIDPSSTRLNGAKFRLNEDFFGLMVWTHSGRESVYDPDAIVKFLHSIGATVEGYELAAPKEYSQTIKKRIQLLDRFLRFAERTYYVSRKEPNLGKVFGEHQWPTVSDLLYRHGIVEDITIPKSGPREDLMKLCFPPDLVRKGESESADAPKEIAAFWRELLRT
jgi:hypothetical protein